VCVCVCVCVCTKLQKVLLYFNTAPNRCGGGYAASAPVSSSRWFELNDLASDPISFRADVDNVLDNGPLQFPSGDAFMFAAVSTNSGATAQEIEFVVSEVGVFIGGEHTNPSYHYVLAD
jgi:hypothetical protein